MLPKGKPSARLCSEPFSQNGHPELERLSDNVRLTEAGLGRSRGQVFGKRRRSGHGNGLRVFHRGIITHASAIATALKWECNWVASSSLRHHPVPYTWRICRIYGHTVCDQRSGQKNRAVI